MLRFWKRVPGEVPFFLWNAWWGQFWDLLRCTEGWHNAFLGTPDVVGDDRVIVARFLGHAELRCLFNATDR